MRLLAIFFGVTLLTGCLGPQVVRQSESFAVSQVSSMLEPGNNTIKGSALINQVGGGTVTCAGRQVTLVPRSTYADERMQIIYGNLQGGVGTGQVAESDPMSYSNYVSATKDTTCNAQGFFQFNNLSDGEYYVVTKIIWGQYGAQGGNLMRAVKVSGGQTVEIVLAP